jgi:hypothetical protein
MTTKTAAALLTCTPDAAFAGARRMDSRATLADTLRLGALQDAAVQRDPRARQAQMQARATELRLRSLDAERLPQLGLRAEATRQSEVASLPIDTPGIEVPEPPKRRYDAALEAQVTLYDSGVLAGRRGRGAGAAANGAGAARGAAVSTTDGGDGGVLRRLPAAGAMAEVGTLLDDLEARLAMVRAQARAGTALPHPGEGGKRRESAGREIREADAAGRRRGTRRNPAVRRFGDAEGTRGVSIHQTRHGRKGRRRG